jgi:PDZ domain-containing protein
MRRWFSRRSFGRRFFALLAAVGLVAALLWFTPTPYYVTAPGAAIDTSRLVAVPGGEVRRDHLYMLIVASQPANLFWYLYARLDPRAELETAESFLGGLENYEQYEEISRRMMRDSREIAKAVALQQLGYGRGVQAAGAEVTGLLQNSPARGYLQPGDVITAVADRPVSTADELRAALQAIPGGQTVTLRIERGGRTLTLSVPTVPHADPERAGSAALGVYIADALRFDVPLPVTVASGQITGPSAGLMFTLQIIDQLTPGGITGGLRVAGTGTIEPDGRVGAIGGVKQKVYTAEAAGADVIFVPQANYAAALAAATRIQVVPVTHVQEALAWLRTHRRGA